jgi:histone H3/H4
MAAKKKAAKKVTKKAVAKAAPKKAAKKIAGKAKGKATPAELIISKSRTKNAVVSCNVSGDFYGALDMFVRNAIVAAENRATENGRKTLRPQDL